MKKFFELGDRYAAASDWKDFALVKFCLCAMGVMLGANAPAKYRKQATGIAALVFLATYIPLMAKVFRIGLEMIGEAKELSAEKTEEPKEEE